MAPRSPRVVATYERGLGFGDFTFPYATIQGHVTDPLAHAVLVRLADRADPGEVDAALAGLTRRYRGLAVLDRAGFQAAQTQEQALNTWVNLLMAGVLLGYIAVSAANSLVMGTSQRARELALLRLVGTTRRQVLAMMRWEGVIVVAAATVIGVVIAGLTAVRPQRRPHRHPGAVRATTGRRRPAGRGRGPWHDRHPRSDPPGLAGQPSRGHRRPRVSGGNPSTIPPIEIEFTTDGSELR